MSDTDNNIKKEYAKEELRKYNGQYQKRIENKWTAYILSGG